VLHISLMLWQWHATSCFSNNCATTISDPYYQSQVSCKWMNISWLILSTFATLLTGNLFRGSMALTNTSSVTVPVEPGSINQLLGLGLIIVLRSFKINDILELDLKKIHNQCDWVHLHLCIVIVLCMLLCQRDYLFSLFLLVCGGWIRHHSMIQP